MELEAENDRMERAAATDELELDLLDDDDSAHDDDELFSDVFTLFSSSKLPLFPSPLSPVCAVDVAVSSSSI